MFRRFPLITAVALFLGPVCAAAQVVQDCQWENTAQAIVEPWEQNTRTFANGETRLTVLDRIEPGAGAMHLHVLSPPRDELGGRQCRIISLDRALGFSGISFDALTAGYDPEVGLMFDVPVQIYDETRAAFGGAILSFTLNQATGALDAALTPVD